VRHDQADEHDREQPVTRRSAFHLDDQPCPNTARHVTASTTTNQSTTAKDLLAAASANARPQGGEEFAPQREASVTSVSSAHIGQIGEERGQLVTVEAEREPGSGSATAAGPRPPTASNPTSAETTGSEDAGGDSPASVQPRSKTKDPS